MTPRQQLFYDYVAQTSDFPLALDIERAEGIYLYDHVGNKYIDFIAGIGVSNVGHRHPKVLEASGINPNEYRGFAFGCGIDRMAMLKWGLDDVRLLYNGDLRVVNQF